jgi:type II secretory pathway component GspD/PulD (secretin)
MTTALEDGRMVETVSFCRVGTTIDVNAVANADGMVRVELEAEWSTANEEPDAEGGYPLIHRQEIASIVELPAGKTAVVAGLVQERQEDAATTRLTTPYGAPVAGDERVFRNVGVGRKATQQRREVVVLITPKIAAPLARVAIEGGQQ